MRNPDNANYWALILGASSGFGEAAALKLAEDGYNILGVHLDRQATMGNVNRIVNQIKAADALKGEEIIEELKTKSNGKPFIKILMHSLAFGTLKRFIPGNGEVAMTKAQLEMTLDVMAHSLVYWTQDLVINNLITPKARIFAMTSSGGHVSIPYYGAVSAAKASLESHVRQLSLELGHLDISVNAIMAGVTDTPAL